MGVTVDLTPVVLEGRHVRLEPLSRGHHSDSAMVALEPDLGRFTPTQIHSADDLEAYIETALSWQRAGTAIPFATVDRSTGRAIGSTRFANIDSQNRRAEIGWTWLGREFQRRGFNTEAKLLILTHAFERRDCIRVELRTDVLNTKFRNAIAPLGATEEGLLRHHRILPDGRLIDGVYYRVVSHPWPSVRRGLEQRRVSH